MKKIRFLIPLIRSKPFEIYFFDLSLKNNTKGQILLKSLYILGYFLLFSSFIIIPLSDLFYSNIDSDTSLLRALVYLVPISIAVFLSIAILNGRKRFIDPPFFLATLLFALGTTVSAVSVATPSLSNTFGRLGLRGVSGVTVISFVALYYLSSVYVHNRQLFRRSFKFLIIGILTYLFVKFAQQYTSLLTLENLTLTVGAIGGIFAITKSSLKYRNLKLLSAILLTLFVFYSYVNGKLNLVNLNYIFIPAIIGMVILLITFYLSKPTFIKVVIRDTKNDLSQISMNNLKFWKLARLISVWLIIFSPIILLIALFYINFNNNESLNALLSLLNNNIKAFNSITESAKSSFNIFLFGGGSINLNPGNSFVANIILSQGFIGLSSYLFLTTYCIVAGARYIYFSFRKGGNYIIPSFLVFMLTLITFEGFFFYPGMKLLYLWWICLALIAVKYIHKEKKNYVKLGDSDFVINLLNIGNLKIHRYIKYSLILMLIILAIYISHSFNLLII